MTNDDKKPAFFINPERIQDMTDGVFAFAMTLLIVGIEFPTPAGKISEDQLSKNLLTAWPTFYKFILSFFLIAIFWITHHKQFKSIRKSDDGLLWINVFILLFVVFIPFTTDIMDDYSYLKLGSLVFNINIFVIGLLFYIQWSHAIKNDLLHEDISEAHKRYGLIRNSITWIVALIALCIGLFTTDFNGYIYLTIPIAMIILNRNKKYSDV